MFCSVAGFKYVSNFTMNPFTIFFCPQYLFGLISNTHWHHLPTVEWFNTWPDVETSLIATFRKGAAILNRTGSLSMLKEEKVAISLSSVALKIISAQSKSLEKKKRAV